jgi:hypothetical protein
MSFFKKISILCAAVQSKKLLMRRRANPPAHQVESVRVVGDLVPVGEALAFYSGFVITDLEHAYLHPENYLEHDVVDLKKVLWTGIGYCLNTPKNREFLKKYPDLDWYLPTHPDRAASLKIERSQP